MRVAMVTPGFSRDDRDWCIPALAHLVRALSQRHEVEVFALRYPFTRSTFTAFGATVHAFGAAAARGLRRLGLLAEARRAVRRAGRSRPFDVIHGLWADEPGWLATAAAGSLGLPAVVSLLGGELVADREIGYGAGLSPLGRWLVRRSLARATLVTVGSRSIEAMAAPRVPARRLRSAPLGVDLALFHPGAAPSALLDGSPRLLTVGSLTPVKDHATTLRAFGRISMRLPEAHLHIVGGGLRRRELEALAGALGVGERVRFHGDVPHDRLPAYYRAADLCVLSSRFESQGMVVLEAAACGTATVGTAVGCLPEVAPELTVPVGDDDALARTLEKTLTDNSRRAAAGEAAHTVAVERFPLGTCAERLVDLYEEATRARRASR